MARRAWDLNYISADDFFTYYQKASEEFENIRQRRRENRDGGGQHFPNVWSRNGKRFSRAISSAAMSNSLLLKCGKTANMNPNNVVRFAKELGIK